MSGSNENLRHGSSLGLLVAGIACLSLAAFTCFDLVMPRATGSHDAAADISAQSSVEPRYVTKKIDDIQPGDRVVARDDVTGQIQRQEVVRLFRKSSNHLRVLTFQHADGTQQTIETTNEHPFWVSSVGWVTAQDLQPGDSVDTADSHSAVLTASRLESHPEGIPVYNFEVANAHSYFVRQPNSRGPPLWVHNDCGVRVVRDDPLHFEAIVNQDAVGLQSNSNQRFFRATAVNAEIDSAISVQGFLSGQSRGVSPNQRNPALSGSTSLDERVIQYVNSSPFPRDANFVAISPDPSLAISIARKTGARTLRNGGYIRLDEIDPFGLQLIDVESVFSRLGVIPNPRISITGERLIEGNIPPSSIINTIRTY